MICLLSLSMVVTVLNGLHSGLVIVLNCWRFFVQIFAKCVAISRQWYNHKTTDGPLDPQWSCMICLEAVNQDVLEQFKPRINNRGHCSKEILWKKIRGERTVAISIVWTLTVYFSVRIFRLNSQISLQYGFTVANGNLSLVIQDTSLWFYIIPVHNGHGMSIYDHSSVIWVFLWKKASQKFS